MGEILREDINIEGILLGLRNDELSIDRLVPYKIISPMFILQQILAPWWWGKKIELTFNDVVKGIVFCASRILYITTNYNDYKIPKTFSEIDNFSIFELFYRFVKSWNSDNFLRSEVSSVGIMANARGNFFQK